MDTSTRHLAARIARVAPGIVVFIATALARVPAHAAADAASNNQRVVLRDFRGPQAARIKDAVESALLIDYALVPDRMVIEAARRGGGRLLTDQDFAAVARTLNVHAFVSATVRKQQDWRVEMVVRKGDTGQAIGRFDWSGRRIEALAASVARKTPARLRTLLARRDDSGVASPDAVVKAAVAPPAADTEAEQPAEDAPPEIGDRARPFLELTVGGRAFSRNMAFAQNVSGVPGYRLQGATAATAEVALHPFAAFASTADGLAAGVGLYGAVDLPLGIGTQVDAAGAAARTDAYGYQIGVRYRILASAALDLLPHAAYMVDKFTTSSDVAPNVDYRVFRLGVAARVALPAHFSLHASVDYLDVLSAGALTSTTFPHATANGIDVALGAGYELGRTFELQASGSLRRYGFDLRARPGDTFVAGGAADQYLSMVVGIAYRPSLGRH